MQICGWNASLIWLGNVSQSRHSVSMNCTELLQSDNEICLEANDLQMGLESDQFICINILIIQRARVSSKQVFLSFDQIFGQNL